MIVVDASAVASWLFREQRSAEAKTLLLDLLTGRDDMAAPSLLLSEVTNIIRQRMRREGLGLVDGQALLAQLLAVPMQLHSSPGLSLRALEVPAECNLADAYDAHDVALAEHLGCGLCTGDQRLIRDLGAAFPLLQPNATYRP